MDAIPTNTHDEDEDSGEHYKTVYAQFGAAVYFAQCLEHGLVNALVYLDLIPNHPRPVRSADEWQRSFDGFMDRQFENTLGQLLRRLKSVANIPADLESKLADALRLRNWLAHDYFRERATDWFCREGRDKMIVELEKAQHSFREADTLLDATFKSVREKWGFTEERLKRAEEELMAKVRAKR